jgi:hypothetical protein
MEVARGVLGVALILGALVSLLTLLNRRDRRASQLRHTVLDQLALPELRGRIGVHIQCAVFLRRRAVIVDLLAGTPHEVWNVFARLASRLPPRVHLVVHGAPDSEFTPPFALKTVSGRLSSHAPYTSLVDNGCGSGLSRMTTPVPRGSSSAQRGGMAACLAYWEPRSDTPSRGDG